MCFYRINSAQTMTSDDKSVSKKPFVTSFALALIRGDKKGLTQGNLNATGGFSSVVRDYAAGKSRSTASATP